MTLDYTYWEDDDGYVGYLDDYPDYITQGETLDDLKDMLRVQYKDMQTFEISFAHRHGKLKIA